nr:alpha-1,3-mannosyl-glycoprotein 4-beta-N-acetylglucosaminyltransferase B-like [Lepeophtheirus salmonis]
MLSTFDVAWKTSMVSNLQMDFSSQIHSGILQIISPEMHFYPQETLQAFRGEKSKDYIIWRSKQNMDYAYLYRYVYQKFNFKYFLQLEDDVIATSSYLSKMEAFIQKHESLDEWIFMHFCRLGAIAKLFRKSDMPVLSEMFQSFYSSIPCDWIISLFSNGKSFGCALDTRFSNSKKRLYLYVEALSNNKSFPVSAHRSGIIPVRKKTV